MLATMGNGSYVLSRTLMEQPGVQTPAKYTTPMYYILPLHC